MDAPDCTCPHQLDWLTLFREELRSAPEVLVVTRAWTGHTALRVFADVVVDDRAQTAVGKPVVPRANPIVLLPWFWMPFLDLSHDVAATLEVGNSSDRSCTLLVAVFDEAGLNRRGRARGKDQCADREEPGIGIYRGYSRARLTFPG